jgi:hypothetical protein
MIIFSLSPLAIMVSGSNIERCFVENAIEAQLAIVNILPYKNVNKRITFFHSSSFVQPFNLTHLPTSKEEIRLWRLEPKLA